MSSLYLGLGSNLGDKKKNITSATMIIASLLGDVRLLSSLYETEPWGFVSEHLFMNAAIMVETTIDPQKCLEMVKAIEREMGRSYKVKNGYEDRVIDIDILLYDDLVLSTPNLTIPHPLIPQRDFVLMPMAEIAPDLVHPTEKCSFSELLERWRAENCSPTQGEL